MSLWNWLYYAFCSCQCGGAVMSWKKGSWKLSLCNGRRQNITSVLAYLIAIFLSDWMTRVLDTLTSGGWAIFWMDFCYILSLTFHTDWGFVFDLNQNSGSTFHPMNLLECCWVTCVTNYTIHVNVCGRCWPLARAIFPLKIPSLMLHRYSLYL